ncbi:MAG TPA: ABC transporter permease [Bryobacteraceae bacterium]|nr:ABC transporter permease [Bryobacteraceae bacterium]
MLKQERWSALPALWQDIRYALRGMRRSPGFTAVAVLSLALGIGANTAIFSLINALMLRPLPVRDPARLVELLFKAPGQDHFNAFDWRNYQHYCENNYVFSGLIAVSDTPFAIHGDGLEPEIVRGGFVSTNYFPTLGVNPVLGRLIGPQDGSPGSPADVAVVSWSYWRNRFNSDPAIVGRQISDGHHPLTIVGVAPRGFAGLEPANRQDIWLPLTATHPAGAATAQYWLKLAARLKPGVSIAQARAEMSVLWQWTVNEEFKAHDDRTVRDWKMEVQPAAAGLSQLRDQFGKPALVLMAVVALLLLIACANIASLLLARAAGRRREMAVRVSLGAGRLRLLRQQLTESVLLSALGGLVGILLANWGTDLLVRIMGSGRMRVELQARPDLVVLLFTAGIAFLTGILFGLAPAWQTFRSAPMFFLRESARAGETRGRRLFGKCLVVAQVAISVALLSAAGLFVRHLSQLEHVDLGFRRDHVLLVDLNPAGSGYDGERLSRAYHELLGRFEAIPGVRSATLCGFFPMAGVGAMRPANVEGYQAQPGERRFLSENWVAPRYFATFGIPLLLGRDFSFQDQGRPRVAIVNETFVRYFFRDGNPIGKHILFDGDSRPFEIVGVVGGARSGDISEPALRFVYFNSFQSASDFSHFALRTSVEPEAVTGAVRRVVRGFLKTVAVENVKTLEGQVDGAFVPERLSAILSGLFSALGAMLAALGLYGLLAYTVARRINEIGIRMALGATRTDITRMVLGDAFGMSFAGLLIGALLAYWGKRFVVSLIPGLPVQSVVPIVFGAAVMVALALLAAYTPARRAARVSPMEALRYE